MSHPVHHTARWPWGDSPPKRIVVLRALMLGDLVVAVPALRALRAAFPEAKIDLCGLPWARSFVSRFSAYLDEMKEFPGCPGLPERTPDIAAMPKFLAEMQAEEYDLAIQLHGSGPTVNPLMHLFGAKANAGFNLPGDWQPDPQRFIPWPNEGLELDRLLSLMEHLGVPSQGRHLEFPISDEDRASLWRLPELSKLEPGRYVCIHPGASVAERRWPISNFIDVAWSLRSIGFDVVVTGSASESALAQAIVDSVPGAIDVTGRTDLGGLGALLSDAHLLVCNDTGVSHIADGLHLPSVVISTGDNWKRWSPPDRRLHRVLHSSQGVTVEAVLQEIEALLIRSGSRSLERIGS